MTKNVHSIQDAKEYIILLREHYKIDIDRAYESSSGDFTQGYERKEQKKALKSLQKAYLELTQNTKN
ncbi:hypothetical protein EGH10_17555 [Brevibacillus laterosporus]|uniref:Uncharacterized protein n=1 Tax=Brevibacillus laterosporus LMG 15441 TaxID=1042163 RepID=A0A075R2M7_BRELA|nr:hypothetical protein [Brevibacillus laterosporus]AIG26129.1 hypothetical protein BRLA_c018060 [Brevibacillus laterosporus LMG 15441]RJL12529.1 hypothetical protein DM460_08985 [Brevibacillus laterosporus]TPH07263.1 hypothetical protein EGH10_17555 [Brevibacillus laterosporus]